MPKNSSSRKHAQSILVIDDDAFVQQMLALALGKQFNIDVANTAQSGLDAIKHAVPDLILLDIEMPGMSGYDACRQIRAEHDIPIIFISSHDTLEDRLAAYDAGGDDFVTKPFDLPEIAKKVALAIQTRERFKSLEHEKSTMQSMVSNIFRNVNDSGILMNFLKSSYACKDFHVLADNMLQSTGNYGVECHIQIRASTGTLTKTPRGYATDFEISVIDKVITLGRHFQFKNRFVVNFDRVSMLVMNMPIDDEAACGRIRDNISILAESAEAIR